MGLSEREISFCISIGSMCNRCGAPQPGFIKGYEAAMRGEPMPACSSSSGGNNFLETRRAEDGSGSGGGGGGTSRGPDWKCLQCQNVNYARRIQCNDVFK